MTQKQKRGLTCIAKGKRPKFDLRILLEDREWSCNAKQHMTWNDILDKRPNFDHNRTPILVERLHWQKQHSEIEQKHNKLRRELFDRQDEVESKPNGIINQLEVQFQQQVGNLTLFTIKWELVQ